MEYVSNLLQQSPGQFTSMITLRAQIVSISLCVSVALCVFLFLFVVLTFWGFFSQNVNDRTLKRVLQYMRSAKLAEFYQCPLEELDPSAGPCINKKGNVTLKYILYYIIL